MKRLLTLIFLLAFSSAVHAQFIPLGGGAGATGPTGPTGPAGPAPTGNAPQIVGYSAANTVEAETLSGGGDCTTATLARAGANSYVLTTTCVSSNGNAFTSTTFGAALNLSTYAGAIGSSATSTTQAAGDSSTKLATTAFVANIAAGINPAVAVQEATAAVLPQAPAYLNGAAGIGATLISTSFSALVVDGVTAAVGDRVLVKNQASTFQNGVYIVTVAGSGAAFYTLTRALDYDMPSDMNNTGAIPVISGTANAGTSWVQSSQVTTVGTDAVTFTQFAYALANQASISGNNSFTGTNTFITHPITPTSGGAGLMTSAPMWARFYGDGNEGAHTTGSETLSGEHWYTTFNCTGTVSAGNRNPLIIRATTSITLGAACALNFNAVSTTFGFLGGGGGGGGGGAGSGVIGIGTNFLGTNTATAIGNWPAGGALGTAGNPGGAGSSPVSQQSQINAIAQPVLSSDFIAMARVAGGAGGAAGGVGGSSGGAIGNAGSAVELYAPLITNTAGAIVDVSGNNGTAAAANSTGGGGGGGGGHAGEYAQTFAGPAFSTIVFVGGGQGGQCTTPALYLKNGAGDQTGTGASLVITGLTTGGLDAAKITVTGGSGYTIAPTVSVVAGTSGITGSPAAHVTISAGAVNAVVIDTAGSGGTPVTYTSCGVGGYGGDGWYSTLTAQ